MTQQLSVELGERSYTIVVGEHLLPKAGSYLASVIGKNKQAIIVTDEQVARLYLHRISGALEEVGIRSRTVIIPAGESSKSLERFSTVLETILEQQPDRSTLLIALGGGVVGDITGFAASVLLRGLSFVQIPTTLLAQVDSSVGGKTGINSRFGKNLIGSFHQPALVLADVNTLATLPVRERLAGYAEIVKYGLINDPDFFSWLEINGAQVLAGNSEALTHAVLTSCQAKAAIVAADEREGGVRALLNLGHTFGHALEAETGYGNTLLHGEAVAIGMMMAFEASVEMGLCPPADLVRLRAHYEAVGLPHSPLQIRADWDIEQLMSHFAHDKKTIAGTLTFILARGIGQSFIAHDVDKDRIRSILQRICTPS
ncbi:MAG: 3-dehydroquinate synthase [Rickettsiales bacterium]|nr:3-dehydroquinate synthase [Rickettsiales bacterium]